MCLCVLYFEKPANHANPNVHTPTSTITCYITEGNAAVSFPANLRVILIADYEVGSFPL